MSQGCLTERLSVHLLPSVSSSALLQAKTVHAACALEPTPAKLVRSDDINTHGDVVKQLKGGGATARGGGDAVQLLSHGAALPLTAAVRPCCHHLAVPVLQVHRSFDTVPERGEAQAEITPSASCILFSYLTV